MVFSNGLFDRAFRFLGRGVGSLFAEIAGDGSTAFCHADVAGNLEKSALLLDGDRGRFLLFASPDLLGTNDYVCACGSSVVDDLLGNFRIAIRDVHYEFYFAVEYLLFHLFSYALCEESLNGVDSVGICGVDDGVDDDFDE